MPRFNKSWVQLVATKKDSSSSLVQLVAKKDSSRSSTLWKELPANLSSYKKYLSPQWEQNRECQVQGGDCNHVCCDMHDTRLEVGSIKFESERRTNEFFAHLCSHEVLLLVKKTWALKNIRLRVWSRKGVRTTTTFENTSLYRLMAPACGFYHGHEGGILSCFPKFRPAAKCAWRLLYSR